MRISLKPRVCSGLLCSGLMWLAGCSNPSSQTLSSLTVTATPATVSVGGAAVLHAVAHLSDGTTHDVTSGTQFTVSNPTLGAVSNGAVTAKAAGTLTVQAAYIEATPAGTSPAAATTSPQTLNASAQVTITAAGTSNVPTITWAAPAAIPYGTALSGTQLNATANVAGTFSYSPAAGTVLNAGTQTLSATFTPSNMKDVSAATATVALTVNQATPVITWPAPAPIAVGTALSATQLDATANVPGSFVYTPTPGFVPAAGTQTLNVVFAPTDAIDYTTATAQASLTVGTPNTPIPTPPVGGGPLPTPQGCGGPTINLNPGMSQGTLQSSINSAPNCSLIVFGAGTYNISSTLQIPCNKLQITGPVSATPTAILAASYQGSDIFAYGGGCANVGSINYLHFENTGGVYLGLGSESNFTFQYNMVTNLPSLTSNNSSESGLFFGGNMASTLSNVLIQFNTFGDDNSCAKIFASGAITGGSCAGILTTEGEDLNLKIQFNKFIHVEEGIHLNQIVAYVAGRQASVCVGCDIEYNFISHYYRIAIEIQVGTPTDSILIKHNAIVDPMNSGWQTMGVSMACCQWGNILGTTGFSPGYVFDDNVLVSTLPIGNKCPPIGVEFWGSGSQGTNSLIQGSFCNGYVWGFGGTTWAITNNYICGPGFQGIAYITNEEHEANPPTMSNNKTGVTCSVTPSQAPTISPAGGSISGSQTVTLSNPGSNTGVWYTTDGSTPVPGSGTAQYYTAPFPVSSSVTVKAVGMWGNLVQPTSYPSGYGYGPSSVVTASFVSGASAKRPMTATAVTPQGGTQTASPAVGQLATLQSLSIVPAAPVLTIGGTMQLQAVASFSDGSTHDVTSEVAWKTADARTIAIGASGTASGLAAGQALLTGSYDGQQTAVLASSGMGDRSWSGPIVIHQGGTYTGNWQSIDPQTAAVTIATTEPVIVEDAHLRSSGNLIEVRVKGANVTVRNSLGVALNAGVRGQPNGVFLDAASPARLDVENNYMENVRDGVLVRGYAGNRSEQETVVIRGNRARNLNGLLSDGAQGYLAGEGANWTDSRFLELENVQTVPGIDVGWNEVIDYPAQSLVSDVIHVYRSSGTPNQALEIHDSYIEGAYPYRPAQDAFAGGGVKTDGAVDDTAQNSTAFTYVHDNQVVGTVGYGIAFAAGHDNVAAGNRVLSSGRLPDGTKIAAQRVGLSSAHAYSNTASYNNTMHDNLVGWTCWAASCGAQGYRRDQELPASPSDYGSNQPVVAKQITHQMEDDEYQLWLTKTSSAGIRVGPSF